MAKIATGNEAIAIKLHEFLEFYTPNGWVVPIHNVAFVPHFMADEIDNIKELVKNDTINEEYPWYICSGIKEYFKNNP